MNKKRRRRVDMAFLAFAAGALLSAGCSPSNVEKGAACLKLGDYTRAIVFFDHALSRNPKEYEARVGMGKALLQRAVDTPGDTVSWRDACMHLEAARTIKPSEGLNGLLSQVWSEHSRRLLDRNDTLGALESLSRSIEFDPRRPQALNAAGIIYFRIGETEKSKTLFAKAAAIDSSNTAVLFNLGMAAWHEGDVDAAHGFWLKGLKLAPRDDEMLYWFARAEKKIRENGVPPRPDGPAAPEKSRS